MAVQPDEKIYIVAADFGRNGRAYLETDMRLADRESAIQALFSVDNPLKVIAFTPVDVSEEIAAEVIKRAWRDGDILAPGMVRFCEFNGVNVPQIIRD